MPRGHWGRGNDSAWDTGQISELDLGQVNTEEQLPGGADICPPGQVSIRCKYAAMGPQWRRRAKRARSYGGAGAGREQRTGREDPKQGEGRGRLLH